jgi:IS6 family transposase
MYLYRAVDSQGNTLDFHLSATRYAEAAKTLFSKALSASHTISPRVITVDKNAAYPKAFHELKAEGAIPALSILRQSKYLNNLIEQDHRFIKRLVKPGMGFFHGTPQSECVPRIRNHEDASERTSARREKRE